MVKQVAGQGESEEERVNMKMRACVMPISVVAVAGKWNSASEDAECVNESAA